MKLLILIATVLAAAGCGGDDEREAQAPRTELTVTVRDGGPPQTRMVTQTFGLIPEDFAPVPEDQACTQIYGGDATATVTGRLLGTAIDAKFSLDNGCEIARWEQVSALLGDPPTSQPAP